jgi:UDP-N-acetylmuramate dehydrogenase
MILKERVPLAQFSTFRIGGEAAVFMHARTSEDLKAVERYLRDTGNTLAIIGGGSNTLFADTGFDGAVLKMEITGVDLKEDENGVVAVVGAGEDWDGFIESMVERGFWGLENLSGIPGSVGASPIQNIGAYGKEVASYIEWVEVFDRVTMKMRRLDPTECRFGYRESVFKTALGNSLIVTRVAFRLSKKGAPSIGYADLKTYFAQKSGEPTLREVREAVLTIRSRKFPILGEAGTLGTAGSFFKNPMISTKKAEELKVIFPELPAYPTSSGDMKVSAAWLIEHVAKMKGKSEGKIRSFEGQALVIVTESGATSHDVITYARKIVDHVREKAQITLEPEVRFVGCAWNIS